MGIMLASVHVFSFVEGIDTLQAVLFILGLILLVVEMFIPGFGIAGGSGVALILLGIVLTARTAFEAFIMAVILLLLIAIVLAFVLRSAKRGKLRKLILWSASKHEDGFSTSPDASPFLGKEGVALTVLRPAGSGEFEGQRMDVVTQGTFIERGTKIKVVRTEGRRIVVEPVE